MRTLISILALAVTCAMANAVTISQVIETGTNSSDEAYTAVVGYTSDAEVTEIPAYGQVQVGTTVPTTPARTGQIAIDMGDAAYIAVDEGTFKAIPTFTSTASTNAVAMTGITPDSVGSFYYGSKLVVGTSTGSVALATTVTTNGWVLLD